MNYTPDDIAEQAAIDREMADLVSEVDAWRAADARRDIEAPRNFTPEEIAELDAAIDAMDRPREVGKKGTKRALKVKPSTSIYPNPDRPLDEISASLPESEPIIVGVSPSPTELSPSLSPTVSLPTHSVHPAANILGLIKAERKRCGGKAKRHPLIKPSDYDPRKQREQPTWEHLPRIGKRLCVHFALEAKGPEGWLHTGFSLNLSYEVEARVAGYPNSRDIMFRALRREFRKKSLIVPLILVSEVAFVVSPEERQRRQDKGLDPVRRFHLHGELACRPEALEAVCEAMRKAAGSWTRPYVAAGSPVPKYARHQLDIRKTNERWLTRYLAKDNDEYSVTRDLQQEAKDAWAWRREAANKWRRSDKELKARNKK